MIAVDVILPFQNYTDHMIFVHLISCHICVLFALLSYCKAKHCLCRAQKKKKMNSNLPLGQVSLKYRLPWASLSLLF